jgi:uncharacterized protein involved in response to NO
MKCMVCFTVDMSCGRACGSGLKIRSQFVFQMSSRSMQSRARLVVVLMFLRIAGSIVVTHFISNWLTGREDFIKPRSNIIHRKYDSNA